MTGVQTCVLPICEMKIRDTTTVSYLVNQLHAVVNHVQSGDYPASGFYLQNIFFEQGDLNSLSFYNKVLQIADSVNAIIGSGVAQWKTFKQAYTIWENNGAQMFQWECGQLATDVEESFNESEIKIFPNPANEFLNVKIPENIEAKNVNLEVLDFSGKEITQVSSFQRQVSSINISSLANGIY